MTKAEIQQQLDEKGIEYDVKATKAELEQLLEGGQPEKEDKPAEDIELVDVVYPLSIESPWNDNELRNSIRSLVKHFTNMGKIYIVGHLPDFLKADNERLIHIPFPDSYTENKDANLIAKLLRACQEEELTDRFLFMSDDQYLVDDVSVDEMVPFYSVKLENRTFGGNKWENRLKRTYRALHARGHEAYEYDTHAPVILEKELFKEVMLTYDWGATPGYCINTLYFSHTRNKHVQRNGEVVRVLNTREKREDILSRLEGAKYFNHNDPALKGPTTEVIQELFPEPSPFES